MDKIDLRIDKIQKEKIGNTSKRILLVEGIDDIAAIQSFLATKCNNSNDPVRKWETRWAIVAAGSKQAVIDILKKESNWIGVIDRDEWSQENFVLNLFDGYRYYIYCWLNV